MSIHKLLRWSRWLWGFQWVDAPLYNCAKFFICGLLWRGWKKWKSSTGIAKSAKKKRKIERSICIFRFLPDLDSLKPRKNSFHIVNINDILFGKAYNVDTAEISLVDIYAFDGEKSHTGCRRRYYGCMTLFQYFKNGGDILIYGLAGPFNVYDTKTKESSDSGTFRTCFSSLVICLVCSVFLGWNWCRSHIHGLY